MRKTNIIYNSVLFDPNTNLGNVVKYVLTNCSNECMVTNIDPI